MHPHHTQAYNTQTYIADLSVMKFHNDGIVRVCVLARETTHRALVSTLTGAGSSSEAVYQQGRADGGIYGLRPLSIIELVLNKEQTDDEEDPRFRCPLQHFLSIILAQRREDGSGEPHKSQQRRQMIGFVWNTVTAHPIFVQNSCCPHYTTLMC